MKHRRSLVAVIAALGLGVAVAPARASAPPVGPLPKGPVTTIRVQHGVLFAIVLPRPAAGLSWRQARQSDATVARELYESEVRGDIVIVFRAGHAGTTTIVYGLTKGEQPEARKAQFFKIMVF